MISAARSSGAKLIAAILNAFLCMSFDGSASIRSRMDFMASGIYIMSILVPCAIYDVYFLFFIAS